MPTKPATNSVAGLLVDLGGRADLLDPALVEDRDPVAHRQRLVLVVRDVDERDPADLALDRASARSASPGGASGRARRAARRGAAPSGRLTIARASATRWRWPPESCAGLRSPSPGSRTSASASSTFARRSPRPTPLTDAGDAGIVGPDALPHEADRTHRQHRGAELIRPGALVAALRPAGPAMRWSMSMRRSRSRRPPPLLALPNALACRISAGGGPIRALFRRDVRADRRLRARRNIAPRQSERDAAPRLRRAQAPANSPTASATASRRGA